MNAIILAGGKATRLGPLAVQLNKCLVTVGQQPMLVRQVNAFRTAGVTHVTVVVSPESEAAVSGVLRQAYAGVDYFGWDVVLQTTGTSPIDALTDGLAHQLRLGFNDGTYVISADTLIDRVPFVCEDGAFTWAHCVIADEAAAFRTWTVQERNGSWSDRPAYPGEFLYTGLSFLPSSYLAYQTLAPARAQGISVSTSWALTKLHTAPLFDEINWQDVGDLEALARARRERYTGQSFNHLRLDDDGIVWKSSDDPKFQDERGYMLGIPRGRQSLFPRVWPNTEGGYGTEHIDQPTLSELWLYWPGSDAMWVDILERLTEQCSRKMWLAPLELNAWPAFTSYAETLASRWARYSHPIRNRDKLTVNEVECLAGGELIDALRAKLNGIESRIHTGVVHGDLSFMNILWSITTGQPKLVDPKGSFGGVRGPYGDVRYDLAKLRYSYHGGVSAILHGLYDVDEDRDQVTLKLRDVNTDHLDAVLAKYAPIRDVAIIEAFTCLCAPALHQSDPREALALYVRGVQLANECI